MADILGKRYNAVVVSTDEIREELFGNAAIQKNPKKVFEIAYKRIEENLRKSHKVIFDAMNLTPSERGKVLELAKLWNRGFNICYWSRVDEDIAKERNSKRKRKVPEKVIDRQFVRFIEPTYDEGWDVIFEF